MLLDTDIARLGLEIIMGPAAPAIFGMVARRITKRVVDGSSHHGYGTNSVGTIQARHDVETALIATVRWRRNSHPVSDFLPVQLPRNLSNITTCDPSIVCIHVINP